MAQTSQQQEDRSEDRSWADRLEYVGIAVEEPGYHVLGASPVIGPEGKGHLFVARWPISLGFGGWATHCEIARYLSDSPEGPYQFKEVVAEGSGGKTWDHQAPHNPNIQKIGSRYVLTFIANAGGGKKNRVGSQRIGMMAADHPAGPYVFHEEPLTSNETEIEDGYAFYENGKVFLLTTHNSAGTSARPIKS